MIPSNGPRRAPPDNRDLEIARLRRQLAQARERVQKVRVEERERFSALSSVSRRFVASMRSRMDERQRQQRRLDAQYAVSRALEESRDLAGAAPGIFRALGSSLGWDAGTLWTVEGDVLRCGGVWYSSGETPDGTRRGGFEKACTRSRFHRGAGLPGRVWVREEPCWVEDVLEDAGYARREEAAGEGLRCALAFPIQDGGRLVGVFELLRREPSEPDQDMLRLVYLVGHQMGQFVERRRAEAERDLALFREREARREATGVLESIDDAFFAVNGDWKFTYVNRRAEEVWGRPRGELLGKTMWEEFPQAADSEAARALHHAMEGRETVGFETLSSVTGLWISSRAYPSAGGISVYFRDITESKRVEAALRVSEERYRTLFEMIDEGFCVVEIAFDGDGRARDYRFLEVNPAFERHTGLREAEGRWMRDLVPDHEEHWFEIYGRVALTGEAVRFVNRAEGLEDRWFEVYAFRLGDGEDHRVAIIFNDATERLRAEEAVKRSEERYRTLATNIPGAVFRATVADGQPSMEFISDRIEEITGYPAGDFVSDRVRNYGRVVHPEDRPRNEREVWRALAMQEPYNIEYRIVRADGETRWVSERGTGAFSEEGELLWMDGAIFDVTGRRRDEEVLRENDEWLRIAQRAARAGTWEWDLATGEIRWSREHRELFGFDPEMPVTREGWWAAVHPEDLSRIEEAGRRCSEEGEEWPEIEYRILRGGKIRWIDARGRTVRDERDRPARILGISVDITERIEAEAERDRLLAQEWVAGAEAAERERISRELHDRVAHSMGVAHQSLQLHEVLLKKDPARAAQKLDLAKEMTKVALESTRNLSAELRQLAAEEGLEMELRNLLDVAVPPHIRAGISVSGDEEAVPGHVRGQLFLILREAVRNAVTHAGCSSISVGLDVGPDWVVGRVEDDGDGFEADGGNGGVGLRSMRERAGLLDGSFRLAGGPGRGTRIEVEVPLRGKR